MKKFSLLILLIILIVSAVKAEDLNKYANIADKFIQLLEESKFSDASALCDSTFNKKMPTSQLGNVWGMIKMQAGKINKINPSKVTPQGKIIEVIKVLELEKIGLDAKIYFTQGSDLISGFFVSEHKKDYTFNEPSYSDKSKFTETDIKFGTEGFILDGKLTLPNGKGPFPAVILVHGSGPNDMDETLGPNKVFRDIAHGLASNGIAVLRYNKRTNQYGAKIATDSLITVNEETIFDVVDALKLLNKTPNIETKHIYILGHSLGGMLLPRIAEKTPNAAGYISMAGSLRSFGEIVPEQYEYIFASDGGIDSNEQAQLAAVNKQVKYTYSNKLTINSPKDSVLFNTFPYYWMDLKNYDYKKGAKAINKPLYVLQGARDYQITIKDYQLWNEVMKGKNNVEFKLYPNLNHLFIHGEGMSTPAEYEKQGFVDVEFITDLSSWIKRKSR